MDAYVSTAAVVGVAVGEAVRVTEVRSGATLLAPQRVAALLAGLPTPLYCVTWSLHGTASLTPGCDVVILTPSAYIHLQDRTPATFL